MVLIPAHLLDLLLCPLVVTERTGSVRTRLIIIIKNWNHLSTVAAVISTVFLVNTTGIIIVVGVIIVIVHVYCVLLLVDLYNLSLLLHSRIRS